MEKIGMDVISEALTMYWQLKGTQIDKLYEYAKINRGEKSFNLFIELEQIQFKEDI